MTFEWDADKARANLAKHGVSFELARRVWDDPLHVIIPDRVERADERWHAIGLIGLIGLTGSVVVLVAVHSYPGGDDRHVRIISARKATREERMRYDHDDL